jgi:hypothetical protein
MNISRYIDKFVNIRYIFLLARRGIQLIISASPNVEITSPVRRLGDFLTPGKGLQVFWGNPYKLL